MRLLALFICLFAVCQATSDDSFSVQWNSFKLMHNKEYANAHEEERRYGIFKANTILINRHNLEASKGLHSYTLKMNKFGDLTREEFAEKMLKGLKIPSKIDPSKTDAHPFRAPSNVKIPKSVDWRKKGAVTKIIEDQGQCGSCWAFTATGALEGQHFIKTGKLVRLSAQNLIDCTTDYGNQGCCGGYMDTSFQYIKDNKGIDTAASYPYEGVDGKCRFKKDSVGATDTGFVDLPKGNETALQVAIATIGPISVAVDALHSSFQFYSSGVYDEPQCSSTEVNHTFVVVGYDTFRNSTVKQDYYIAKNSWGPTWGNKGYIWMSRNKKNQCGIATIASYPLV